ncbi:hypothetical protein B0J12DRAFT_14148 [Macrophomina phaseolina]|uniref:Secreted protein n=1 Tax=Macrophomina phaseolina TaxID=35725 RepID=A0ABQ8GUB1_9PEZI|nr:hypothetical protein B0J12DRAFT_14148 [Macrophomina phaseolina]
MSYGLAFLYSYLCVFVAAFFPGKGRKSLGSTLNAVIGKTQAMVLFWSFFFFVNFLRGEVVLAHDKANEEHGRSPFFYFIFPPVSITLVSARCRLGLLGKGCRFPEMSAKTLPSSHTPNCKQNIRHLDDQVFAIAQKSLPSMIVTRSHRMFPPSPVASYVSSGRKGRKTIKRTVPRQGRASGAWS